MPSYYQKVTDPDARTKHHQARIATAQAIRDRQAASFQADVRTGSNYPARIAAGLTLGLGVGFAGASGGAFLSDHVAGTNYGAQLSEAITRTLENWSAPSDTIETPDGQVFTTDPALSL